MVFKNLCILVLLTKVASALEGIRVNKDIPKSAIGLDDIIKISTHASVDPSLMKTNPFSLILYMLLNTWNGESTLMCRLIGKKE